MRKIYRSTIPILLVIICCLITLTSVWGQMPPLRTPDIPKSLDTYFPDNLQCSEATIGIGPSIEAIEGRGADVGFVTIGETTIENLIQMYTNYFLVSVEMNENWVNYAKINLIHFNNHEIHESIDVCIKDDIIISIKKTSFSYARYAMTALEDDIITSNLFELSNIQYFVSIYGIPDIVTYSPQPTHRLAFWFEEGIIGEFYIRKDYVPAFGKLNNIVYLPFQEVEGYEERYPFNQTYPDELYLTDIAPTLILDNFTTTERNPFDFDAILESLTPTPLPR